MIVASLPTTWAATISTDSGITGLTLPGMIELPGWRLGIEISPMPQRGPEASQRMSLAILVSEVAIVFERAARSRRRRPWPPSPRSGWAPARTDIPSARRAGR